MTTMMEYAMVRLALRKLDGRFDPFAPPVGPTRLERLQVRFRRIF
jgi:hypothetical protein